MIYVIWINKNGTDYYLFPGPNVTDRMWTADISQASKFVTKERAEEVRQRFATNGKVIEVTPEWEND